MPSLRMMMIIILCELNVERPNTLLCTVCCSIT